MTGSFPTIDPADRRLNFLDDQGNVLPATGRKAQVDVAFTELRKDPGRGGAIDTQVMFGEIVHVQEERDGWALVQAERDQYVGWLETSTLSDEILPATHLVSAPRTFFYPEADLKLPHKGMRSMGSALQVTGRKEVRGTRYAILHSGEAVFEKHIRPIDDHAHDFVSVAEQLISTPYLWAGTTAFGIDCSGLIKLAMFMAGYNVLRDSDLQAASIGNEIDPGSDFGQVQRGDLVFWRGHAGICQGPDSDGIQYLIHANAHTMDVTSEPLGEAIERIAYLYEQPLGFRRP